MKLYGVLFSTLLLVAGCASKSYVKLVDNSIERYIEVSKVNKRTINDGLIEIQIIGKNKTDEYRNFRYRVVWEDKDGFKIPSLSSTWIDFPAYKNAKFRIDVIAPNAKATQYQIYIDKKEN